jgi:hypothetical protein
MASGEGITPLATQWLQLRIRSYSFKSNLSTANGNKGKYFLYPFLENGRF